MRTGGWKGGGGGGGGKGVLNTIYNIGLLILQKEMTTAPLLLFL